MTKRHMLGSIFNSAHNCLVIFITFRDEFFIHTITSIYIHASFKQTWRVKSWKLVRATLINSKWKVQDGEWFQFLL